MELKYYLKIEIRYSIPEDENLPEDTHQQIYFNKFINSDLFNTEEECINYGNNLIIDNRWIEQYPGYKGLELKRKLGYPLVAPSLKNGAKIFISVRSLKIFNYIDMNLELQKFNIREIKEKL